VDSAAVGLAYHPKCLDHDTGLHPESADRLRHTMALIESSGLIHRLTLLNSRQATLEELSLVHTPEHIAAIRNIAARGGGRADSDTIISPGSYEAALFAAGATLEAVDAVIRGDVRHSFALVRPPGHHARPQLAMGFCLFNNIAIAARHLLNVGHCKKVLIVDFDVHHGNGTQEVFESDGRVLYFSTHQSPLFPGTGHVEDVGSGPGRGLIVNVPLPPGRGDDEFLKAYSDILVPLARRFQPEFMLVSAGYDAHWADSIASEQMTVSGFASLTRLLKDLADELCEGRMALTLEGGYDLRALAESIKATFEVMLGNSDILDPLGAPPRNFSRRYSVESLLAQAKQLHGLA
jgi:acetoin utilization deacetylase AcuC-like enzyme